MFKRHLSVGSLSNVLIEQYNKLEVTVGKKCATNNYFCQHHIFQLLLLTSTSASFTLFPTTTDNHNFCQLHIFSTAAASNYYCQLHIFTSAVAKFYFCPLRIFPAAWKTTIFVRLICSQHLLPTPTYASFAFFKLLLLPQTASSASFTFFYFASFASFLFTTAAK